MPSQLELSSRAALCRQFAKLEPASRALWMAEAESWARLSNAKLPGQGVKIGSVGLVNWRARWEGSFVNPTSARFA